MELQVLLDCTMHSEQAHRFSSPCCFFRRKMPPVTFVSSLLHRANWILLWVPQRNNIKMLLSSLKDSSNDSFFSIRFYVSSSLWNNPSLDLLKEGWNTFSSIFFFLFCFYLIFKNFLIIIFFYFTILCWFCQTSTCIHHRCTCVPHPEPPPTSLPIPSLWVIPVHQPQASCILHRIWTGDLFLYDITHVLMPFSQLIPPFLSHRFQKTVLYICVSFAVLHTGLSLPSF